MGENKYNDFKMDILKRLKVYRFLSIQTAFFSNESPFCHNDCGNFGAYECLKNWGHNISYFLLEVPKGFVCDKI